MANTEPDPVESVADAVLNEGLLLYPYRPSALKNRQRWNFGVLFPPSFCARAENGDRAELRVECLAEAGAETRVALQLRFLQLGDGGSGETIARAVAPGAVNVREIALGACRHEFFFGALRANVEISAQAIDDRTAKISAVIANVTPFGGATRDEALSHALLSCHALLSIEGGAFYSMVEAPPALLALANCRNIGVWPVLVGAEGARNRMLASPIILSDYPRIAPQSPAAMFDGTEIDELLSLRIQTLTPEEKAELRRQPRTAALLERVDSLATEELAALHGTWSKPPQVAAPLSRIHSVEVHSPCESESTERWSALLHNALEPYTRKKRLGEQAAPPSAASLRLKPGDAVILRPKRRADIFDLALAGRRATVSSIERDFEDRIHVCVTIDDDPGRDLGLEGKPGHRFFFDLDEVERP